MQRGSRSNFTLLLIPLVALLLSACSTTLQKTMEEVLPDSQPEYRSSKSLPPLEVPPDLSSATIHDSMPVPESAGSGSTTYSDYQNQAREKQASPTEAVLPESSEVKLKRDGDKRWLVVDATPAQVWPRLRQFWLQNGFTLKTDDPAIGIMETDWAENKLDIPKGFLSSWLGKLLPQIASAATRDKFRTRIERGTEPGTTEIYVSHRGAEVKRGRTVTSGSEQEYIGWTPRPSDPGLEAEMLHRMIVFFGVDEQRTDRMFASTKSENPRSTLTHDGNGGTALTLPEDFSRAWRRTGLALDRVGFTVEDRDRSRGLYYVRYVDPDKVVDSDEESWLSKLKFWDSSDKGSPENAYLISLKESDQSTRVVVLNKEGQRDKSSTADRILSLLHEQLK